MILRSSVVFNYKSYIRTSILYDIEDVSWNGNILSYTSILSLIKRGLDILPK